MAIQIAKEQIKDNAIDNSKLDLSANYTFTGTLAAATPSADSDVAIKSYVDGLVSGLHWKKAVEAATTANITLSGTQTVDGVSLSAGDRILVKDQSDATENGIYVVAASGWSRATDMDAGSEFPAAAVFVKAGTVNDNLGFTCTNNSAPDLGTDDITFTQFNGAANIVAGDGLAKSGNTLSVNVDGSSLEINSDALRVKTAGITNDMLAGSIANTKLANSTISGIQLGNPLASLSAGNGIAMTSYNGSSAVSDLTINTDGSSLTVGPSGLKVSSGGIGSIQLADNAVSSNKIATGAVGTAKIADDAITSDKIQDGAVGSSQIANNAVGNQQLQNGIGAGKLQLGNGLRDASGSLEIDLDGTTLDVTSNGLFIRAAGVGTTQLADNAVTLGKMADNSVDTNELVDDAVTEAKIADGAVVASALATNAVTNAKIADDAVTAAKLSFSVAYERLSDGNGSTTTFDASSEADTGMAPGTIVFRNGLAMQLVAPNVSPSGQDQYSISPDGGTNGVLRITFGSAPDSGDQIAVMYYKL